MLVFLLVQAVNVLNGDGLNIDGDERVIHRTATRVSLTCRLVTKVRKNLIKL